MKTNYEHYKNDLEGLTFQGDRTINDVVRSVGAMLDGLTYDEISWIKDFQDFFQMVRSKTHRKNILSKDK